MTQWLKDHPHYTMWKAIKQRCLNPKNPAFVDYGGRGICIYEPWVHDYFGFQRYVNEVLGVRPENHSIDRKDNDGDYEPGNLRWASKLEQSQNRRILSSSGHRHIYERARGCYRVLIWRETLIVYRETFGSIEDAIVARDRFLASLT